MPPIDPRFQKAKRYPVHAAVTVCDLFELKRLLSEDAEFHVGRKVPDLELSVLHSACSSRPLYGCTSEILPEITRYCIEMGAPLNDRDAYGQTALHYAVCNQHALPLVTVITDAGAQVDPDRMGDGWTPLHLAAMFGKKEVALKLLEAGADTSIKSSIGETAEDVAKRFNNHRLADVLSSPRSDFAPTGFPSQYADLLRKLDSMPANPPKFKEEHVNWRDEDGNSLLHYATWTGNTYLARAMFDSPKMRKLVSSVNNKGGTPLAMAILASQDKMVEDFFMNKNSKKLLDFTSCLKETKQTISHLLLAYAPYVPPKFLLKRKDLTREMLNTIDVNGNTPVLHAAMRNSIHTVSAVLNSKAVKDGNMLDLGIKNKFGKTVLHYLVQHKDEENFRLLLDHSGLTADVANSPDLEGRTPLVCCLLHGSPYMGRDILQHPTAKDKFRLDLCHTKDGRSPLHLVAEQGNGSLWKLAVERKDCDLNARDKDGNTPLMRAAVCGQEKMLEAWLLDKEKAKSVDQSLVNNDGKTLMMLFVENLSPRLVRIFLNTVNAKDAVNHKDKDDNTAFLSATVLGKWSVAKELLSSHGLKNKIGEADDDLEGTVDVHPVTKASGQSALTIQMLARVKLARNEQTFMMKKQRVQAVEAKKEQEEIWEVVKLVLLREKELHGTSMTQGRDGGSDCIKNQLAAAKLIRPNNVDEVVQEFVKLYQFIKRKKPASNVPPPANKVNDSAKLEEASTNAKQPEEVKPPPVCNDKDSVKDAKPPAPKAEQKPAAPVINGTSSAASMKPTELKPKPSPESATKTGTDKKDVIEEKKVESPKASKPEPKIEPPNQNKTAEKPKYVPTMSVVDKVLKEVSKTDSSRPEAKTVAPNKADEKESQQSVKPEVVKVSQEQNVEPQKINNKLVPGKKETVQESKPVIHESSEKSQEGAKDMPAVPARRSKQSKKPSSNDIGTQTDFLGHPGFIGCRCKCNCGGRRNST